MKNKKQKNIIDLLEKQNIDIIDVTCLPGEKWIKLETKLYPDIKQIYYISNKNRIYSIESKKLLKIRCLDPNIQSSPYYKVSLQVKEENGKYKSKLFYMHRLMMIIFNPTENMEKLYVNHIDGNKLNNELSNLEWCTPSENAIHAYRNKLFVPVYGENHCCTTLTNNYVDTICKLIVKRELTLRQIASVMGTSESIINSIAEGKSWKEISKKYDLSVAKHKLPKNFTFKQIHDICQYFEDVSKDSKYSIRRYCMNALKSIKYEKEMSEATLNSVRKIYERKRYEFISKDYNF